LDERQRMACLYILLKIIYPYQYFTVDFYRQPATFETINRGHVAQCSPSKNAMLLGKAEGLDYGFSHIFK
jgi:hypothetical protein